MLFSISLLFSDCAVFLGLDKKPRASQAQEPGKYLLGPSTQTKHQAQDRLTLQGPCCISWLELYASSGCCRQQSDVSQAGPTENSVPINVLPLLIHHSA